MHRKLTQGTAIGLAAALLATLLHLSGALSRLEAVTWDWRARAMAAPGEASDDIAFIFLDQASLTWVEETMGLGWPWPREIYAAIIGFCQSAQARSLTFDVLFTEASEYADQDQALGAAIAAGPPFAGAVFFEHGKATFPIPEVATNATVLGSVLGDADPDGIIRRIRPSVTHEGITYPTLGLAALLAADTHPLARHSPQGDGGTSDLRPLISDLSRRSEAKTDLPLPLDRSGRAILRWRGDTSAYRIYSAQSVIQSYLRIQSGEKPVVEPETLKDKYVFFGFTAPGLMDLRSTPISPVYPGVGVHATLLDNALSGDLMRELPAAWSVLCILLVAMVAGITGRRSTTTWQVILACAALLPLPLVLAFGTYAGGWWLPVAAPTLAVALGLSASIIVNYAMEGRQKRFIKGAFKQYLNPALVDRLTATPESLKLGGELRELSIFFSDVAGFTGISEHLGPEALTSLLNTYLTAMTNIILEEGGTIDKYEGDAIIAFWNAPLDLPDHPVRAVRAAIRCQAKLDEMRPVLKEEYGKEIHARIGVNTGPVVVGNMGSDQRFDYTFLGDAGNLASRLEGINKQFDTAILISEYTAAKLDDSISLQEISRVRVVGRKEPVRVFRPLPESTDPAPFAAALNAYYEGNFEEAATQFTSLAPADPTAAIYAARCQAIAQNPPEDWNGVWEMTEK
ncbi:MAG: adenylate/guanylate cyclase domain-containing protein [Kiritimatiellia bacterium]|jgi:adenylate cyclase|nr:adenylate/guanylate cyclase domain-containing protein [Kiritimatiellia bacterium]MDP6629922.1 adenylate/guanylate cyclase domain-containing protein [Kiritimatiellia bacterium]MDP6810120.1 adenylate/guanylate cyclase domain-containing protein [Kiritimatiellia bacterium]MDP7023662.1 adenylate/guanylate cyclase domain-containing protein [Kiritimatiellia bacterium]